MSESKGHPSSAHPDVHHHVIETERIGLLNVYIQGDIDQARKSDDKPIFLTVHDMGKNHNDWLNFVYHPTMAHVRERAVFIHVDLLGQEDDADDLRKTNAGGDTFVYPTLQQIGEDLVNVIDTLRIKVVMGLGDGAGSNILLRFAAIHHGRCLGIVLINPTAAEATLKDQFKEKFSHSLAKIHTTPENYLVLHKFGHIIGDSKADADEDDAELIKAFEEFKEKLSKARLNQNNVRMYVDAFLARDDAVAKVKNIKDDMLLVSGAKSAYANSMEHLFQFADKTKTSQIKIDEVCDVLDEAPGKFAHSLLLFCKGLGWLTTLEHAGLDRGRSASQSSTGSGGGASGRRMSMEEYDRPNIRRLSLIAGSKNNENAD